VSYAVASSDFEHNPAGLICDLQNNDPALLSLFQIIDNTLKQTVGERNAAQEQLQRKSDLCNTLSSHLASAPPS
jgi:hypothetical protein